MPTQPLRAAKTEVDTKMIETPVKSLTNPIAVPWNEIDPNLETGCGYCWCLDHYQVIFGQGFISFFVKICFQSVIL